MDRCCVLGCLKSSDDGVTLHEFPVNNKSLLPIWIMATHRSDWTPLIQSRMCDEHFIIEDFEDGDKNKMLKPNACPMINNSYNVNEDIPSYGNFSDIDSDQNSDDLPETPDTSDMDLSDDSIISIKTISSAIASSFRCGSSSSSLLESAIIDDIDGDKSSHDLDVISLSSTETSFENTDEVIKQNCAVALCNEKARNQFDNVLFLDIPNEVRGNAWWWELCGQTTKFDPSFKICSIHFNADDIGISYYRRADKTLFKQIYLKHDAVPSLYLTPQEYTRFNRKRKNNINNENNSKIQKNSTENEECITESCQKDKNQEPNIKMDFVFKRVNKDVIKIVPNSDKDDNCFPWEAINLEKEYSKIQKNSTENEECITESCQKDKNQEPNIKIDFVFKTVNEDEIKIVPNSDKDDNCFPWEALNLEKEEHIAKKNSRDVVDYVDLLSSDDEKEHIVKKNSRDVVDYVDLLSSDDEKEHIVAKINSRDVVDEDDLLSSDDEKEDIAAKINSRDVVDDDDLLSSDDEKEHIVAKINSHDVVDEDDLLSSDDEKEDIAAKINSRDVVDDDDLLSSDDDLLSSDDEKEDIAAKINSRDVVDDDDLLSSDDDLLLSDDDLLSSDDEKEDIAAKINSRDVVEYVDLLSSDEEKVNEINVELKTKENTDYTDDPVFTTFVSNISSKNLTPELINKKKTTSTNSDSFEKETILVPKSKNSGNDSDYIYLDSLSGNDIENFVLFDKKEVQKNIKTIITELEEKYNTGGVPKAIIYNNDLIENCGKMLPAHCDPRCVQACYNSITGPQRTKIYEEFRMLDHEPERNCKITQLVKLRSIKNSNSTFDSCPVYHLMINKTLVKVCRTFFMNTLGIPENRLNAILEPNNYSWFFDEATALESNQPIEANVVAEPVPMTDFVKESLKLLEKDYKLFDSESDTDIGLEGVPFEEYKKVMMYFQSVPRVLSCIMLPERLNRLFFETTIKLNFMYKFYSEDYIKNNNRPPPYTQCQFKKIYNKYMKNFLD